MSTNLRTRTFTLPDTPPTPRAAAFAKAVALVGLHGGANAAERMAEGRFGPDDPTTRILKAAIAAGTTTDSVWAAPLASDNGAREVFQAIRERSILGRLDGARRVPPNLHIVQQVSEAVASWVKQASPKPVTRLAYQNGPLLPILKVQAQIVATKELLRLSTPSAEDLFRESLLAAVTKAQDQAFIDPANAGVTEVRPKSITSGVTAIVSAGNADADLAALFAAYTGDWETAALICNGKVGAGLGGAARPNAGARGGDVSGVPLICSRNCPAGILVLADAGSIAYFEEAAGMDISEAALVEMSDAPTDPPVAATVVQSAWAHNMAVMRVELFCNWTVARSGAVGLVSGITW